ncbi:MAG: GDP-mannose 4,6-dehydratase [Nitrospinae bacterium]|nr:GDP-mannose 4,6-dehydratase [Nitrospinota bacterium]
MRALITGVSGFVGAHLARLLAREPGTEVFGVYRDNPPASTVPGRHFKVSLENPEEVAGLIKEVAPDGIYHLAAVSFPGDAALDRVNAYKSNFMTGVNLLEAAATHSPKVRFLYTSSSEVYGLVRPEENPLAETREARPVSAYAVSKYCLELVCRQYAANPGLAVMIARPFNHTGPGQRGKFVAPEFAMQIARIEAGKAEPVIRTGNLDSQRDFTDARDVVEAYVKILRQGERGETYNVCSGGAVTVEWIYKTLVGLSQTPQIRHELDMGKARPSENPAIFGSREKLEKLCGWRPAIPLERTLRDLLEDCRRRVGEEG